MAYWLLALTIYVYVSRAACIGSLACGKLATSYYDRQYGDEEATSFSDVSLSESSDLTAFAVQLVTTGPMPSATQFGGPFFGDYTGLTAVDNAYPLWMDTRDPELFLCPGTGTTTTPPAVCTASADNAAIANDLGYLHGCGSSALQIVVPSSRSK